MNTVWLHNITKVQPGLNKKFPLLVEMKASGKIYFCFKIKP